ncbi:GTPase Era [Candidatus Sumerlaeota bacterium]|nr:GTPase Era [Candidatus Sumerlaeota bacterium]
MSHPQVPPHLGDSPHRSGFAAILGRPNAGKSTLLNALIGEKIAIVSRRPQTTRDGIRGILSRDDFQIVFVDTPGIIDPHDRLNEALMANVEEALEGIDVALHLFDATEAPLLTGAERAIVGRIPCPRIVLATKCDLLDGPIDLPRWLAVGDVGYCERALAISAVTGEGLEELIEAVRRHLPEGEPLYDEDQLTDRDLRFLAGEAVREKVFELTGQELPYATAVQVQEFREGGGEEKTFISAIIYVERDSQRGMIVGKGGQMIRQIGQEARRDIEALLEESIFLDLRVKVRKNWRRSDPDLRMFGYRPPRQTRRRGQ